MEQYDFSKLEPHARPRETWSIVGKRAGIATLTTVVVISTVTGRMLPNWLFALAFLIVTVVWGVAGLTSHHTLQHLGYDFNVEKRVKYAKMSRKTEWGHKKVSAVTWAAAVSVGIGTFVAAAGVGLVVEYIVFVTPHLIRGILASVTGGALLTGGAFGLSQVGDDHDVIWSKKKLMRCNKSRIECVKKSESD